VERYNFKTVEENGKNIGKRKNFFYKIDKNKKKFYCLRNVSISIWKNSYGTC
jgi:hypothetical protein